MGLVAISIGEEPLLIALVRYNFRGPKEVSSDLGKGQYKEPLALALA
jgi:hypothetical protein